MRKLIALLVALAVVFTWNTALAGMTKDDCTREKMKKYAVSNQVEKLKECQAILAGKKPATSKPKVVRKKPATPKLTPQPKPTPPPPAASPKMEKQIAELQELLGDIKTENEELKKKTDELHKEVFGDKGPIDLWDVFWMFLILILVYAFVSHGVPRLWRHYVRKVKTSAELEEDINELKDVIHDMGKKLQEKGHL